MTPKPKPTVRGLSFQAGNHTYRLDGKPIPGVTTILGCLDKPAIPKWAAGQVAEFVADNPAGVDELRSMGRGPMVQALKAIPWQRRDTAASRGSILHAHAENILHGREVEVEEEHVGVMESALAFMDDWRIEPLLIEAPVASRTHWWAGTLDLIASYKDPRTGYIGLAIFDWKSGKSIYPEYAMQMNAYAHAEFTGLAGDEHPPPVVEAAFGVQIRDDSYDVHPLTFGPAIYDEFVAIRTTFDIVKRMRGDWKRPGSGYVGAAVQPLDDEGIA